MKEVDIMNQLEKNLVASFNLVREDVINLKSEMAALKQTNQHLNEVLRDTRRQEKQLYQRVKTLSQKKTSKVVKKVLVTAQKTFVASKTGKKVHNSSCPFAKNIKPKKKMVFKSKAKALNKGFKSCECLKR